MKNIKMYLTCLFVICGFWAIGQIPTQYVSHCNSCDDETDLMGTELFCGNTSPLWSSNNLWIPDENHETKYLRVNMIFLHKDDGTGNFISGNQEHDSLLADLFAHVNNVYSNLFNPSDPDCHVENGFLADSKVQFIPNIIHINNSTYWNNENHDLNPQLWNGSWLDVLDNEIVQDTSIPSGINVYFTETESYYNSLVINHTTHYGPPITSACSQFPSITNLDNSSRIHMPDVYSKYYWMKNIVPEQEGQPWNPVIRSWFVCSIGDLIAHELGHSLGLSHIFYCHHNLMYTYPGEVGYEASLSPEQIGIAHRNISISNIRKFTTDNSYISYPYHISENTLWDINFTSYRNVIIEPGACLTITCKLVMKSNTILIVKQGGKLVIDGGIITTEDDTLWQGIEVWGDKNEHQYPVNGVFGQGYVELKNGAVIENAVCALELWHPGDWSSTGGIVHATDAVFRNNSKTVHALNYTNHHPISGKETDYNAFFKGCDFVLDEDYIGDQTFHKHADLAGVNGITFSGCSFTLSNNSAYVSPWNSAIAAYDAGFTVKHYCDSNTIPCPEADIHGCTFNGFYTAVNYENTGGTCRGFNISRASFNNNTFGVISRASGAVSVSDCVFVVGGTNGCGAGILCDGTSIFKIEGNSFRATSVQGSTNRFGIVIRNSQAENNIFGNTFRGLHCANYSDGLNWKDGANYLGLCYECNDNDDNIADFYVGGGGIQSFQGSSDLATGNTFSDGAQWHFYNGGQHLVTYYHHPTASSQTPTQNYGLSLAQTSNTNNCSKSGGSILLTSEERLLREQDYSSAFSNYSSVKSLYDGYVDGGDTEQEMSDVNNATPSDMWALKSQLLGHSPHLSENVLFAVADRDDVFSHSVLFEIMAANPDELRKDTLISYLEGKHNPLPEYMVNILRQMANGTTLKTTMQQQMASYRRTCMNAAGDIIRSILADTVTDYSDLREWLDNLGGLPADRQIIASYIGEGNYTSALALANMLPALYNLTGTELADNSDYIGLIELYREIANEGRTYFQMTPSERQFVMNIADNGQGYSQLIAQNVIDATSEQVRYNPDCPEITLVSDRGTKDSPIMQDDINLAVGFSANVNPNPATTWVAIEYTLPEGKTEAVISISNALGVRVISQELVGNSGEKVLDLRNLADGVYVYSVSCGEYSQTGRIVVTK